MSYCWCIFHRTCTQILNHIAVKTFSTVKIVWVFLYDFCHANVRIQCDNEVNNDKRSYLRPPILKSHVQHSFLQVESFERQNCPCQKVLKLKTSLRKMYKIYLYTKKVTEEILHWKCKNFLWNACMKCAGRMTACVSVSVCLSVCLYLRAQLFTSSRRVHMSESALNL